MNCCHWNKRRYFVSTYLFHLGRYETQVRTMGLSKETLCNDS